MISCIICSRQREISAELNKNITSTIGCDYELIVVDNSTNDYSIFSAYNEGVQLAKGDILCFMHEDIVFYTEGWGKKVVLYFQEFTKAGMIGVAGTHFLSSEPSGWWETEIRSSYLLQGCIQNGEYKSFLDKSSLYKSTPTKVVAVDGLWMCIPRKLFNNVRWDIDMFRGFHGYDIDMSLQVWKVGFEVHIIWDVLIEHKSLGNVEQTFYDTYELLWRKWINYLPMVKGVELSSSEQGMRTKIIELNNIIRKQNKLISQIYQSKAYRLGMLLIKPLKKIQQSIKIMLNMISIVIL